MTISPIQSSVRAYIKEDHISTFILHPSDDIIRKSPRRTCITLNTFAFTLTNLLEAIHRRNRTRRHHHHHHYHHEEKFIIILASATCKYLPIELWYCLRNR